MKDPQAASDQQVTPPSASDQEIMKVVQSIKQSSEATPSAGFITCGIFDSFDIITLVDRLEKKYNLTIPGEEIILDNLDSVEAIASMVRKHLNVKDQSKIIK